MRKRLLIFLLVALGTWSQLAALDAEEGAPGQPRAIVQITVDQLRGDMLPRHRDQFGTGGFRRLMDQGLYYANAHYGTANTFTAAGHAVLVTGADTAEHGMVGNEWFDRDSGKVMYATFDAQHGLSPANLTSTTIGDELVSAHRHSRSFAVAGKDRSAIIPAGRLGKAFWLSDQTGGFVSSTYYYDSLPAWVQAWPGRKLILGYGSERSGPPDDIEKFVAAFRRTPRLDEYTLAFAQELIRRERIGQDSAVDYLSISLSGADYIGHAYGPSSGEYEDNLLKLDAHLANFLAFLDERLGRDRFVVVLSADHGVDDSPEAHRAQGYDAERFYPKRLVQEMNGRLKRRFGISENLIVSFVTPGFYLDHDRIVALGLDFVAVQAALAQELRGTAGVAYAFTRTDLLAGRVPRTRIGERIQRGYHPNRSGDVIIVQKQFWYLHHEPNCCVAMHGSPYSYDTFVPVIFYGPNIPARTVRRSIEPASIAPTLAVLLHIKPPSGSSAPVLSEVLDAIDTKSEAQMPDCLSLSGRPGEALSCR